MVNQINDLLKTTNEIKKRHKEISILRGESFNIFSVLKMESNENKTHSAFLAK